MKVEVVLYAALSKYMPADCAGSAWMVEIPDEVSVVDLLQSLRIPANSYRIIFVNGRHALESRSLRNGDRVAVFPPIAGG